MKATFAQLTAAAPAIAIASLALNLLLGYQLCRVTAAAPSAAAVPLLSAVTADQLSPPHPLLGGTLQPTSERAIIAQQLKLRLWSSYPRTSDHYWQASYHPLPESWLQHRRHWLRDCRAKLLQLFGPTAVYEPLFSEFFFPLRELMPFLSSAAQARIYAAGYRHSDGKLVTLDEAVLSAAHYPQAERLATLLNPPELYEFELRYSATAQTLRNSGAALTEQQFREVFQRAHRYRQQPSADRLEQLYTTLHTELDATAAKRVLAALTHDD